MFFLIGNRTQRRRVSFINKGVRIDSGVDGNIVHIDSRNKGVRKSEYVMHYGIVSSSCKKKGRMLKHNKPCLCGSLQHATTKHRNCLLNPQYDDNM